MFLILSDYTVGSRHSINSKERYNILDLDKNKIRNLSGSTILGHLKKDMKDEVPLRYVNSDASSLSFGCRFCFTSKDANDINREYVMSSIDSAGRLTNTDVMKVVHSINFLDCLRLYYLSFYDRFILPLYVLDSVDFSRNGIGIGLFSNVIFRNVSRMNRYINFYSSFVDENSLIINIELRNISSGISENICNLLYSDNKVRCKGFLYETCTIRDIAKAGMLGSFEHLVDLNIVNKLKNI